MRYVLPDLPYPYNALEPHMDEETVRIHHDMHHNGYVNGLNNALDKLEEARKQQDFALIKHWERELAFNGAGHMLHTLYWESMSPHGGGQPRGRLANQIESDFGGFESFVKEFSAAAAAVEGSGWALLVYLPEEARLAIVTVEKHQNLLLPGAVPLLALDVWEHAYYLKYKNKRADFIKNWWNLVNWRGVEYRFEDQCGCCCSGC
ncbi:MAG: superoxide dismutase [Clostridiales bacterium]|jgi:Fe-Mn family superoxide dismutase|nr:superoxide dismutase [Clostridiales bacterium]HOC07970.1 superoxide dismutase [Bacillota bacterium]HQA48747.1 superoxide dismutase [Bacillota bacterium]HQD42302.1 superoxide dismutase [Bacillota bacterium]